MGPMENENETINLGEKNYSIRILNVTIKVKEVLIVIRASSQGFPTGSDSKEGKESACHVGDLGFCP